MSIFLPYVGQNIDVARYSPSSHILLQHPAPVPFVIAVDRRVWLARAPACLPFVQCDDALPSGMRRIDAAIRRDKRDRFDSRGNLHLRPPGSAASSEFRPRHACTCRPSIAGMRCQPLAVAVPVRSAVPCWWPAALDVEEQQMAPACALGPQACPAVWGVGSR